ncbi:MAG: MarR family transcriptional regulator [Deltaproteobacteria bacterium]|nr:MarR family transcriptional regulator [Deltaproteobacteria bacterium]
MKGLLNSTAKEKVLLYLGLRGGCSGRRLAKVLKKSPSQIFKALNQLIKAGIIKKEPSCTFYVLNRHYPYYEELISIILKKSEHLPKSNLIIPKIQLNRKVDPIAVYEILELRNSNLSYPKLSKALSKYDA